MPTEKKLIESIFQQSVPLSKFVSSQQKLWLFCIIEECVGIKQNEISQAQKEFYNITSIIYRI